MTPKTIIRCRKNESGKWSAKIGKITRIVDVPISRLVRLLPIIIEDKNKVNSIDIIIKRRR